MKLQDLKNVKLVKVNPVAKHVRGAGAGTHKTPKDYVRREKHSKDLRRVEEDWTASYMQDNIDKTFNSEEDADALIKHLKDRGFRWTQKTHSNGRYRVRGIKRGISVPEGSIPDETITITLGVKGDAKQRLAELLHSISSLCSMGASRTWGIIDGDNGEGDKVSFDGDGADKLIDVKINGKPVKDYLK